MMMTRRDFVFLYGACVLLVAKANHVVAMQDIVSGGFDWNGPSTREVGVPLMEEADNDLLLESGESILMG